MMVPPVFDLPLHAVENRGVSNQERIVLRTGGVHVDLAIYFLGLGYRPYDVAQPLPDALFWLGDVRLDPLTWIFVYTGPGQIRYTKTSGTNEPAYVLHWGRPYVVFFDNNIVPILMKCEGITVNRSVWLDALPAPTKPSA